MSIVLVYCAALALFSLCWANDDNKPTRPPGCDAIHPLDGKEMFDHNARSPHVINRFFQNRTAIGISWTSNPNEDEFKDDLCGFTLHWFQDRLPKTERRFEIKDPNETSHMFTDLQPGTKYQYYVVTYYVTQHEPRSWKLITYTDGCGPDVLFEFCDQKGTESCNETTGSCNCKTTQTTGEKCDSCPNGFYMHYLGCTACDHCPNDTVTSTGNCKPAPQDTMTCDCLFPHTGKHCRECVPGFYWKDDRCSPCQCLPDKDDDGPSTKSSCDPLTGKCVCAKDRAGHNCEKCAEGYFGNPLTDRCIHTRNAGVTALIVIVVLIIAAVVAVTTYLVCRRRIAERMRQGFFKAHLREDYDKVNFTTLEEEPEFEPGRVKALNA